MIYSRVKCSMSSTHAVQYDQTYCIHIQTKYTLCNGGERERERGSREWKRVERGMGR